MFNDEIAMDVFMGFPCTSSRIRVEVGTTFVPRNAVAETLVRCVYVRHCKPGLMALWIWQNLAKSQKFRVSNHNR
jgi:hypothetical protein